MEFFDGLEECSWSVLGVFLLYSLLFCFDRLCVFFSVLFLLVVLELN